MKRNSVVFALIIVSACSGDRPALVADSVAATLSISAVALAGAPALEAREGLRITGSDTTRGYLFVDVVAVGATDNGRIVVADRRNKEIVVFDSTGRRLMKWGREGQGPGEIDGTMDGMTVRGDTVFVLDNRLQAMSLTGRVLYTAPRDLTRAYGEGLALQPIVATKRGLVFFRTISGHFTRKPGVDSHWTDSTVIKVRSAPTATLRRVLVLPDAEYFNFREDPGADQSRVYGSDPAYAVSPDGDVFFTPGNRYAIDVLSLDGPRTSHLVGEIAAAPVTKADVERYFAEANARIEGTGDAAHIGKERQQLALMRKIPVPPTHPVLGQILAGDDSTFLVARRDLTPRLCGGSPSPGPTSWDLISLRSGILGRLTMPARFCPHAFHDGHIYGVKFDDTDVPEIVRFDIVGLPTRR